MIRPLPGKRLLTLADERPRATVVAWQATGRRAYARELNERGAEFAAQVARRTDAAYRAAANRQTAQLR